MKPKPTHKNPSPSMDGGGTVPLPQVEGDILTLRLKAREENRILAGHQWIFSNELETVEKNIEPGSLAVAVTSQNRALGIGFYNPHSLIAWRLASSRVEPIDANFFKTRLEAALGYRRRLYPAERSFRLCFGESDGMPGLVIDKYEDFLVLQVLSAGIERHLPLVAKALQSLLEPKGIFLNNDHPSRHLEGLKSERRLLSGSVPDKVQIEENGIKYSVPLTEGQKTGFYFDQRDNRARLIPYMCGRKVLDLYCYMGGFSLTAAKHGAEKVLGLDSSAPAIELARENAKLNSLESRVEFDVGDAEEVLGAFNSGPQTFAPDMVLLDPPSYVPSKKHLSKAIRAYVKLNSMGLKCLKSGGLLATSTCSHHVSRQDFLQIIREAGARAGKRLRLLELGIQAKDHPILLSMPETEYLHFALVEVY